MQSFVKSFILVFFSWIKLLFNDIINILNSNTGFIAFISKYWFIIAGLLLVIGIIIDWTMYFIRWRPHYVWFGRKKVNKEPEISFYSDDFKDINYF